MLPSNSSQQEVSRVSSRSSWFTRLPVLATLTFFVFSLGVSLLALFQSQDLRQQASADKVAELVLVSSSTPLKTDTTSTVFVRLDTKGQSVDGAQVVFELKSNTNINGLTLRIREPNGLRKVWEKVESVSGGQKVQFALTTSDPTRPYANNGPVDIAEIIFTAKDAGTVDLVFDDGWTKVNKNNGGDNILKPITAQQFKVEKTVATTTTQKSPTPTPKTTTSGTTTATPKPTPTPTPYPFDSGKAVGGSSLAYGETCNTSCVTSSECEYGLLCHSGSCRRIGNVNSTTCAYDSESGYQQKQCNEACTSHTECGDGLTCFEGQCRLTANPADAQCIQANPSSTAELARLCNVNCTVNEECGNFLSCYQGKCRLPNNPTHAQCIAGEIAGSQENESTPSAEQTETPTEDTEAPTLRQRVISALIWIWVLAGVGIAAFLGYRYYKQRQAEQRIMNS